MNLEVIKIEIAKLECRKGDVVVVKAPETWNPDQIGKFIDYLHYCFRDLRFMGLPANAEVSIITPPPEPAGDPMLEVLEQIKAFQLSFNDVMKDIHLSSGTLSLAEVHEGESLLPVRLGA